MLQMRKDRVNGVVQRGLHMESVVTRILFRHHLRKVSKGAGKGTEKPGGKKGKIYAMVDDSGTWWYSESWMRSNPLQKSRRDECGTGWPAEARCACFECFGFLSRCAGFALWSFGI